MWLQGVGVLASDGESRKLSDWSIKYTGPRHVSFEGPPPMYWYELHNPKDNRLVAIVGITNEHKPILNPVSKGVPFDYGPIPQPDEMTPAQIADLWGSGDGQKTLDDNPTYNLVSKEKIPFQIELVFANGKLQKYKISPERFFIQDASCMFDKVWVQVGKENQGEKTSYSP